MAEVIRYVDPDATGSGTGLDWTNAYTSLSAWEAAEQTDLVSAGDWHHVYCRSSSGTADSLQLTISGWTTDATHYIKIEAASGDEALKTGIDTNRYRYTDLMTIDVGNLTIQGLQIVNTATSDYKKIIYSQMPDGGILNINNCYIKGVYSDTVKQGIGIAENYQSGYIRTINIYNTIITGFKNGAETNFYAILESNNPNFNIYNTIVENCHIGIDGWHTNSYNCAVFNNDDDFSNGTIDHCASDDGDGTNPVSPSGGSWTNEFNDPANGDFTLLNTGNLYHGGSTAPDSSLYTTDIEGDTYNSGAYSIGVDEYVSGGGGTTYDVSISESTGLSETQAGSLTIGIVANESVGLNESEGSILNIPTQSSDQVNLSDIASVVQQLSIVVSESIGLSDYQTTGTSTIYDVSIAENMNLSETQNISIAIPTSISESIGLSDTQASILDVSIDVAEGINFQDTISAVFTYAATVAESMGLTDIQTSGDLVSGRICVAISSSKPLLTITATKSKITIESEGC